MEFKQTDLTKKFIEVAKSLIDKGIVKGQQELADKIGWEKSSISNTINGRRNIPDDIAKNFQTAFKVKIFSEAEDEIISDIKKRLLRTEAHLEVYESAIAQLLTKKGGDFLETVASLRSKVQEAAVRLIEK